MFANIWGRAVSKLTVWSVYWEMTSRLPATGTHRQTEIITTENLSLGLYIKVK